MSFVFFRRYTLACAALIATLPVGMTASAAESTGAITGAAMPDAQIVVTGVDSGQVVGIVARCDGAYRAESLKPGRYAIVVQGPHHATRTLSVEAGKDAHVDLAPASDVHDQCKVRA
jgi:hypothetical protein